MKNPVFSQRGSFTTDPPANVTILGPDVVESDDHLELACSANANPAPTFAWTEDLLTTENGMCFSLTFLILKGFYPLV